MWQFNFAGFFDIFLITKCGKIILLQSVTDCYYKVRQLLQSATVITMWDVTLLLLFLLFHQKWKEVYSKSYFTIKDRLFKGTVINIEKALIHGRLRVSKVF